MGNCLIMGAPKPNQVNQKHIGEVDMNGENKEYTAKDVKPSLTSRSISPSRSPREFTLDQLRKATSNFALYNLVGAGGFGHVYKGGMEGCEIAVKVLNANGCQGHKEWLTEVEALGKLHHPNLVQLIGLCSDHDQRLLVYKYMPMGSLDNALSHKECSELNWERRLGIATGIAKGLAYLHNQQPPIIHRDLKPSNILIDSNYEAKLCDFGLARDGPTAAMSHVSTRVMGTHAYVDPEYFQTGKLRLGSDVYGFGVVLLQILTGRAPLVRTSSGQWRGIADWARPWLGGSRHECRIRVIMDPRLRVYPPLPAFYAGVLASRCTSPDLQLRPTADRVVSELRAVACHMVSSRRLHNGD